MTGLPDLDIVSLEPGSRRIPYREAWDLQRKIHQQVVAGDRPDTLLLVEHDEVFTAGSRTQAQDRPTDGSEVIDVDRGGRITWHGPGQLVGYPILRLANRLDVVGYVRTLESVLIDLCAGFNVAGVRVPDRSGVWVIDAVRTAKVAAIGVRVSRGVTMHGFAVNCDCDTTWQNRIVPCGIPDAGVTSLSAAAGRQISVSQAVEALMPLLPVGHRAPTVAT